MSRFRLVVTTASVVVAGALAAGSAAAAPARVTLSIKQPTASVPRVQLTAKTTMATRSVVFRGRWKGADGVTRTRKLGVDEVASNGFGIGWDASKVPRATSVRLTVRALDARGRTLGASAARTWKSPGRKTGTGTSAGSGTSTGSGASTDTGTPTGTPSTTDGVAGTIIGGCPENGTCVVAVRSAPSTASTRVEDLASGTKVTVQCRATGQTVPTPSGTSSEWVRIAAGRWVFGPYVKTPPAVTVPTCAD